MSGSVLVLGTIDTIMGGKTPSLLEFIFTENRQITYIQLEIQLIIKDMKEINHTWG